jgi:hypothetical protein
MRRRGLRRERTAFLPVLLMAIVSTWLRPETPAAAKTEGASIAVQVEDPTHAVIVHASVDALGNSGTVVNGTTDGAGIAELAGLAAGRYRVKAIAPGFRENSFQVSLATAEHAKVIVRLEIEGVSEEVAVTSSAPLSAPGSMQLTSSNLQILPQDHDELVRTLQTLAAGGGGIPGQAEVRVDGFLSSANGIPPRSSIGEVRINPDLFASEYEQPPYRGGVIEIDTKPGSEKFHGRFEFTGESSLFDAADPFAPARPDGGVSRFEASLDGPIKRGKSSFTASLEQRVILRDAVVNAVLTNGTAQVNDFANVSTPQLLWNGFLSANRMVGATQLFRISAHVNVVKQEGVGVGGMVLPDGGEDVNTREMSVLGSHMWTLSPTLLNTLRLGWTGTLAQDVPTSNAVRILVPGFFESGGAEQQNHMDHRSQIQLEDALTLDHHRHLFRFGLQVRRYGDFMRDEADFNGAYLFGGTVAPQLDSNGSPLANAPDTYISGLEQYRRTLLGLPGGTPSEFRIANGAPAYAAAQWRVALYGEDQMRLSDRLTLTLGGRLQKQTIPTASLAFNPRFGMSYSVDSKRRAVIGVHVGLFAAPTDLAVFVDSQRLAKERETLWISYQQPFSPTLKALTGTAIETNRIPLLSVSASSSVQAQASGEFQLPKHWGLQGSWSWTKGDHLLHSSNINAPTVIEEGGVAALGSRPYEQNGNEFAYQSNGRLNGRVIFAGLTQAYSRRYTTFLGLVNIRFRSDADTPDSFHQSAQSEAGELRTPDWQVSQRAFWVQRIVLPKNIEWTSTLAAGSGVVATVLAGGDNNQDGVWNDRPNLLTTATAQSIATGKGIFDPTAINGNTPRNTLTGPYTLQLDAALARTFHLGRAGGVSQSDAKSLSVTVRSTNLANHMNATAIEGGLLSPYFGSARATDPGRRVEFGLTYNF